MNRGVALLLASALSLGAVQVVFAADMPVKAPATIVAQNWTGCYVGLHLGHVWGTSKQTYGGTRAGVPDAFLPVGFDVTGDYKVYGVLGGGEGGCNYQIGSWVAGVEIDGGWTNASGSAGPTSGAIAAGSNPLRLFRTQQSWLASARGRLGYAAHKWLWYVTGGIAFSGFDVNNDACAVASNGCRVPTSVSRTGWIAGVGAEYALGGGLSVKSELLYADFGTFHYDDSPAVNNCVQCYSMDVKMYEWMLRFGINYRFHSGA
jgi:outer membrane immunogenic protein